MNTFLDAPSSRSCLFKCLSEVKLHKFYDNFLKAGIHTCAKLSEISMLDFADFGVTSIVDRVRLFQLIQIIKSILTKKENKKIEGKFCKIEKSCTIKSSASCQLKSSKPLVSKNSEPFGISQQTNIEQGILENQIFLKMDKNDEEMKSLKNCSKNIQANNNISKKSPPSLFRVSYQPKSNDNDKEKILQVKETIHDQGYNYGVISLPGPSLVRSRSKSKILSAEKVKVCVRKRPRNDKETKASDPDIVSISDPTTVIIHEQRQALDLSKYVQQHVMYFDEVFPETSSNKDVYTNTVRPLVDFVLNQHGAGVCFSFGQTGAGKTHTMIGDRNNKGLYVLAAEDIFENKVTKDAVVWVSFYEIYCRQLFDLLNNRNKLTVMEKHNKQVCITGLMETPTKDVAGLIKAVNHGRSQRSRGISSKNSTSSRSHAVLQIDVRNRSNKRIGRLTFIDLAGCERACDAQNCSRQARHEGAEINQSLLALKECIRCLDQEQSYKPYRQSKLTHILRESFTGNCRTVMIANISPTQSAVENTLNTLRYADRVQDMKKERYLTAQCKISKETNDVDEVSSANQKLINLEDTDSKDSNLKISSESTKASSRKKDKLNIKEPVCLLENQKVDQSANSSSHIWEDFLGCQSFRKENIETKAKRKPSKNDFKTLYSESKQAKTDIFDEKSNKTSEKKVETVKQKLVEKLTKAKADKNMIHFLMDLVQRKKLEAKKPEKVKDSSDEAKPHEERDQEFFEPLHDQKLLKPSGKESFVRKDVFKDACKEDSIQTISKKELKALGFLKRPQKPTPFFIPQSKTKVNVFKNHENKNSSLMDAFEGTDIKPLVTPRFRQDSHKPADQGARGDNTKGNLKEEKSRSKDVQNEIEKEIENIAKYNPFEKEKDRRKEECSFREIINNKEEDKQRYKSFKNDTIRRRDNHLIELEAKTLQSDLRNIGTLNPTSCTVIISPSSLSNESSLVSAHELHLNNVTQLCRKEVDLLVKLRTGHVNFDEYLKKIRGILEQKKNISEELMSRIIQVDKP